MKFTKSFILWFKEQFKTNPQYLQTLHEARIEQGFYEERINHMKATTHNPMRNL